MRSTLALALLVACNTPALATPPPNVRVWDSRDDSSITEGETTLAVTPDAAYAAAIDYPLWTTMFPDVARVEVTSQAGVDAHVALIRPNGHRDNVHFHNRPQARTVWFEDTGGRADVWAEIAFLPGDQPGTTRVHSRLYAEVHGVASLFVRDSHVRSMREQRVTTDLTELHAYFDHLHVAAAARGAEPTVGSL